MAGIGFLLRKLTQKDNLMGIFEGYLYSAFIATGPWLLTIICLGTINLAASQYMDYETVSQFRLIVIYNFGFSLVFCGPLLMVVTRFLGDKIFAMKVEGTVDMFLGALATILITQVPLVALYYWLVVEVPALVKLAAFVNYFIICGMWLVMVFLSAIKAYRLITWTFFFGMTVALGLTVWAARADSVAGMITGFSFGLLIIVFTLIAYILAEYPRERGNPFAFFSYFREYWDLAAGGFAYNAAIWADKWIMWFSPEQEEIVPGMPSYPDYDSAMFFAFITIVPTLTIFLVHLETSFYERYLHFYREIRKHAHYDGIMENHKGMIRTLLEGGRTIIVLQGTVTLMALLLTPKIFEIFDLSFSQISIFRFGVLGAIFHAVMAVMFIVLYYFDYRRLVFQLCLGFLAFNTIFTIITLNLGFPYYGVGYFLAALIGCAVTAIITVRAVRNVPYQTFVLNNKSVM